MIIRALFTGSRVYGNPRSNSDLDIVLLVDKFYGDEFDASSQLGLCENSEKYHNMQCNLGPVNIIYVMDPIEFAVWEEGTKLLKSQAPVSRIVAVETFEKLRTKRGLK